MFNRPDALNYVTANRAANFDYVADRYKFPKLYRATVAIARTRHINYVIECAFSYACIRAHVRVCALYLFARKRRSSRYEVKDNYVRETRKRNLDPS